MSKTVRWGILSTGRIAAVFAGGVKESKHGRLVAVGSRTREKADAFGEAHDIPNRYGSYEQVLQDPEVDAVYIAPPHPMHAHWAYLAAEAGKHILCEKPLTLNHAEAMRVIDAAKRNDVFLMEAFMYRCHPQTMKLVELLQETRIGEVRTVQTTFSFHAAYNAESRLFKEALGGGSSLDVGCYTVSMSRLIAGAAVGEPFADPVDVAGFCHIEPAGTDEYANALLKFPNEIIGRVSTGIGLDQGRGVWIYGTKGSITIPNPWTPGMKGEPTKIIVQGKNDEAPEEIAIYSDLSLYALEADNVAKSLERKQAVPPAMTWEDTLGNMKTLDMWRESAGMIYQTEKQGASTHSIHGKRISPREFAVMTYGDIPGLEKKVSRLVMGVDNQRTQPHADALFDDYFERGGNSFDSAYIYGQGITEKLLGNWIRNRGVREEVVILDKGAHTPFCDPENLTEQLLTSLDRIQSDYIDIYMMHRDNLAVPVGEFVDVLNEHRSAGRVHVFGVSNWTLARIEEFNRTAQDRGLSGLTAVSNNFSLARMIEPPWDGCLQTSDAASREWFQKHQMPLMPWSSQARGFFVRGIPDYREDPELVRCWYSSDNFRRLERAKKIAGERGVQPINIALAYVLCQPFPTFPLIGPRSIGETRSSLKALNICLNSENLRWLNLED